MDYRQSPLLLSFSVGRLFRTDIRVSFFMPLLLVMFCLQLKLQLGLLVFGLLVVTILIHEFAHVLAARQTGGGANEILIWPLGGLAFTQPAYNFRSQFLTVAAGPISNLLICLVTLPMVYRWGLLNESIRLVVLPPVDLKLATLAKDCTLLMFAINFRLLLINLLPVYPLDGGQMAIAVARRYRDARTARQGVLWAGVIVCVILIATGNVAKINELMFLAFVLAIFVFHEFYAMQMQPQEDDSFMGYDFSQGYTSLERSADHEFDQKSARPGPLQRWKEKREEERRLREEQERIETERLLDELLQKVHEKGMDSLSDTEKSFLTKASARYRSQGRSG